jgi:hypothetical protein
MPLRVLRSTNLIDPLRYMLVVSEGVRNSGGRWSESRRLAVEPDFDVIAHFGRELDLFDLDVGPAVTEKTPGAVIEQRLARLDTWIRSETGNRTSLNSVTMAALLAGAVWQAARGQLLPTATQLVWYVLSLATERPERGRGMREQEEVRDGGEVPSETKTPGKTGPRDPRHQ